MKAWLMEYLSISKKERTGFLVLLALVSCIWVLPRYFGRNETDIGIIEKADSVIIARKLSTADSTVVARSFELFYFDPNLADDNALFRLGLSDRNIKTIRNYLDKGGRFRMPADIHRIYGIRKDIADRLEPYIRIRTRTGREPAFAERVQVNKPYHAWKYEKKEKELSILDLNTADTAMLIALPGIGSKLASRIILFREKCGGFYNIDQLTQVYGLQDSVFRLIRPRLKIENAGVRKLQINVLGQDSLARHPYISYSEARAIVQYRQQHGPYRSADDLLKLAVITSAWLEKVGPYLEFN